MKRRTGPALVLLGVLLLVGCGDGGASSTGDAVPSPTGGTVASPTTDATSQTTSASATSAEATSEESTTTEPVAVPELSEIWPEVRSYAQRAESLSAWYKGTSLGTPVEIEIIGRLDDTNYDVRFFNNVLEPTSMSFVRVDDVLYAWGNEAAWQGMDPDLDASLLDGRWVVLPLRPGDPGTEEMSLTYFWEGFLEDMARVETFDVATSSSTRLAGDPAYYYKMASGETEVWISADDRPRLLKLRVEEHAQEFTIVVNDWDAAELVEAPEDAVPFAELVGS